MSDPRQRELEYEVELKKWLEPRTDLILVTCNRLEFTKQTLKYLYNRTTTPFRLIVVDNGSTDGTKEWLTSYHNEIDLILLGRNYGLEHARAIALTHVSSKYHVYFDNDLVCPSPVDGKDWLQSEIEFMDKYPEYGAMAMHPQLLVGAAIDLSSEAPEVIHNNHVGATFLIMRTDLMKEVGWNLGFTNRYADHYFGQKFSERGFKSGWIKKLWCYHFFGENWGYKEGEPHYHREIGAEIWPPPHYNDRLVDPYTLEPKDDGVNMLTWEGK